MLTTCECPAPSTLVATPVGLAQRHLPALARRGMNDLEQDYTRPLLLGYVRRDLLIAGGEVSDLERRMSSFATAEGFAMGSTYVEKPGTWPAAFEALVESVNRYDVTAVVLPSLLHFVVLGGVDMRERFGRITGARVLVLTPP